jgi:hypothetical protein
MPLVAGSRLGHYEVIAPLGAGGMGEVDLARDDRLQREVALEPPRDGCLDPVRKDPEFVAFMARLRPTWEEYRREAGA